MEIFSKNRIIYFDERLHKYTDQYSNPYTSVTTVIAKYGNKFQDKEVAAACARIGRNPNHPKYLKYKNKSVKQILDDWNATTVIACTKGNKKHDFIEKAVKLATGYNLVADTTFINDRIYTLDDVIENPGYGELKIDWFIKTGIDKRYPRIFNDLVTLTNNGFRIYAEIGVYDVEYLISGLIDLFITDGTNFIIFDWKTNRSDIRFESGYYNKDIYGNPTSTYVYTNKYMKPPLTHLADSVGNHYALQLNSYARFAIKKGLHFLGCVLYQIRENDFDINGPEKVDRIQIPNFIMNVDVMFQHHFDTMVHKTQTKLFI